MIFECQMNTVPGFSIPNTFFEHSWPCYDLYFHAGLSHELNMQKMRLLTFMQMCEGRQEIEFSTIQQELQLMPEEIEAFIIDG